MNPLDNISIVLVEPQHPGNVGMVCRAMKNMGLTRLRIVKGCRIDHPDAVKFAVSAGDLLGTPLYMAKEQLVNFKYVKPVADVWSLGATFYDMLTGRTPRDFPRGCDPCEVILRGEIVPLAKRERGISTALAAVIDRAVQANPKDRYQDAAEMLAALGKVSV